MVERRLVTLREELIRLLPVELLEVPARREPLRSAARALFAITLETLPRVFLVCPGERSPLKECAAIDPWAALVSRPSLDEAGWKGPERKPSLSLLPVTFERVL